MPWSVARSSQRLRTTVLAKPKCHHVGHRSAFQGVSGTAGIGERALMTQPDITTICQSSDSGVIDLSPDLLPLKAHIRDNKEQDRRRDQPDDLGPGDQQARLQR